MVCLYKGSILNPAHPKFMFWVELFELSKSFCWSWKVRFKYPISRTKASVSLKLTASFRDKLEAILGVMSILPSSYILKSLQTLVPTDPFTPISNQIWAFIKAVWITMINRLKMVDKKLCIVDFCLIDFLISKTLFKYWNS